MSKRNPSVKRSEKSDDGVVEVQAHPFLKWAGGKQKLVPELLTRVPKDIGTYHEPFLGGGALFFALQPREAMLSDINPDLVSAYRAVRDDVERVILLLKYHIKDRETEGHLVHYSRVRAMDASKLDYRDVAARMIYLNKTCFNGLWRVNKVGRFNTPMGKFKYPPTICDEENLRACSRALQGTEILHVDFQDVLSRPIGPKDFVYFDPPYVPLSSTANFTAYAKEGFGPADQKRLSEILYVLKVKKHVRVLLSNAGSKKVRELYRGFKIEEVFMRRNINCKSAKREEIAEYLIT